MIRIRVWGQTISGIFNRLEGVAGWFILLSGWARHASAILAGIVSAFALAPFDIVPLLFFTFPVLVWLLDGASSEPAKSFVSRFWNGFLPGFFFGFGYFLAGLWWIGNALLVEAASFAWALPLAVIALPMLLALFWGVATGLALLFWNGNVRRVFVLALFIAGAEFARGTVATGFPWNTIGYAAFPVPILMQSASVFGVYAMSAFVVLVASLAGTIVPEYRDQWPAIRRMFALGLTLVAAHILFGFGRTPPAQTALVEGVSLRLVQPAIPQTEKFDLEKHEAHLRRYLDLSTSPGGTDKPGLGGTTHLFWPESVFPYLLTERKDSLSAIAAMLPDGTSLITGAARAEAATASGQDSFVFNSVYVINDKGLIVSAADKVHLVPFGEYLPFQDTLESIGIQQVTKLEGGFEAGASRKLLSTGTGPSFLPLICYEIIFSGVIWSADEETRPGFIANLTNDAWFGYTPGPFQHERQSVVRAVEEGLPLVRVANNGISGVYDAYGRAIARLDLTRDGIIDAGLPEALPATLHSRYGSGILAATLLVFALIAAFPVRRRRISTE